MNWCDHMSRGWGGGLMMILWIILITALILWIVRITQRSSNQPLQSKSAMDILKKRYARVKYQKQNLRSEKETFCKKQLNSFYVLDVFQFILMAAFPGTFLAAFSFIVFAG